MGHLCCLNQRTFQHCPFLCRLSDSFFPLRLQSFILFRQHSSLAYTCFSTKLPYIKVRLFPHHILNIEGGVASSPGFASDAIFYVLLLSQWHIGSLTSSWFGFPSASPFYFLRFPAQEGFKIQTDIT